MNARLGSFDLHCHSTSSDGSKTAQELVLMAKEIGLKGLSITDHDTVSAYTDELFIKAQNEKIELITGVEFSTQYYKSDQEESIHVLGYDIDVNNKALLEFCNSHTHRRKDRLEKMIDKLSQLGINITKDFLSEEKAGSFGRPHIALKLIELGVVKNMEEAFKKYLGEKTPFYVKSKLPTIEETINVIKNAGGKASLAHPILIKGKKILKNILLDNNFDAIECYYGNFQRDRVEPFLKLAKENNLKVTGGSDYHGEQRTFIFLGSSFINEKLVRDLLSTF